MEHLLITTRNTIRSDDILYYAQDPNFPDIIFLGSTSDFQRTSIGLMTIPIEQPQPVLSGPSNIRNPLSKPQLGTSPTIETATHPVQDINMD